MAALAALGAVVAAFALPNGLIWVGLLTAFMVRDLRPVAWLAAVLVVPLAFGATSFGDAMAVSRVLDAPLLLSSPSAAAVMIPLGALGVLDIARVRAAGATLPATAMATLLFASWGAPAADNLVSVGSWVLVGAIAYLVNGGVIRARFAVSTLWVPAVGLLVVGAWI